MNAYACCVDWFDAFSYLVFFASELEKLFYFYLWGFNSRLLMRTMEASQVPKNV